MREYNPEVELLRAQLSDAEARLANWKSRYIFPNFVVYGMAFFSVLMVFAGAYANSQVRKQVLRLTVEAVQTDRARITLDSAGNLEFYWNK